ncbi:SDR family NAD(P)-dependent oxidoreductase [Oligosphaera ethanolica]|jgi:NAD(P)-dependent dehydrogenase (short-subunit alcohol dehydrogenase family)|uniref:NAD(P)-dependent dehydrogenase (Short-subunit alcohol dehydrogenase family) n=1 Tax=Oligosphaera ethanolica TaxID=760260 RepID=A0AAE4APE6_9BACT|nr:3-oxoacyl-ACP reductase family protein [Oligosphaera ethanolica]MDQ0291249.1 NAD(P)-dependent dehydrogenase (short-subunit alcohol dehydrogenase family) [Oligosphaera ethanolica]NLE53331.1 3-oxoacyl-ACP reductase FabG [Lentisphaerota bacterium]HQL09084.1 3-oxoacyl-ACP reductase family protein [Lentisphaeria bacterium]
MGPLQGKVAVVTGASRGLGKGVALVLAEQGADVVVNYRSQAEEAEEVCRDVRAMGVRALALQADVGTGAAVDAMFAKIDEVFGRIDILVNNAGTSRAETIFEMTEESWDFILSTNLKSMFLCSKAAMLRMREQHDGRIINMSSVVGHQGALFGHVHYAATKSGILGFTKTLARTGAPLGITVNAVAPGIINTELLFATHGEAGVKKLADGIPLGLGEPRDIGLSVAFLAGEGGRYITGTCIDVNGGMYMRS